MMNTGFETKVFIHSLRHERVGGSKTCFYVEDVEENSLTAGSVGEKFLWQAQKFVVTVINEALIPKPTDSSSRLPKANILRRQIKRRTRRENEPRDFEVTEVVYISSGSSDQSDNHVREYIWSQKDVNTAERYILVRYMENLDGSNGSSAERCHDVNSLLHHQLKIPSRTSSSFGPNYEALDNSVEPLDDSGSSDAHRPAGGLCQISYTCEKLVHVSLCEANFKEGEVYCLRPISIRVHFDPVVLWVSPREGTYGMSTSHFHVSERVGNSVETKLLQVKTSSFISSVAKSLTRSLSYAREIPHQKPNQIDNYVPNDVVIVERVSSPSLKRDPSQKHKFGSSELECSRIILEEDSDSDFEELQDATIFLSDLRAYPKSLRRRPVQNQSQPVDQNQSHKSVCFDGAVPDANHSGPENEHCGGKQDGGKYASSISRLDHDERHSFVDRYLNSLQSESQQFTVLSECLKTEVGKREDDLLEDDMCSHIAEEDRLHLLSETPGRTPSFSADQYHQDIEPNTEDFSCQSSLDLKDRYPNDEVDCLEIIPCMQEANEDSSPRYDETKTCRERPFSLFSDVSADQVQDSTLDMRTNHDFPNYQGCNNFKTADIAFQATNVHDGFVENWRVGEETVTDADTNFHHPEMKMNDTIVVNLTPDENSHVDIREIGREISINSSAPSQDFQDELHETLFPSIHASETVDKPVPPEGSFQSGPVAIVNLNAFANVASQTLPSNPEVFRDDDKVDKSSPSIASYEASCRGDTMETAESACARAEATQLNESRLVYRSEAIELLLQGSKAIDEASNEDQNLETTSQIFDGEDRTSTVGAASLITAACGEDRATAHGCTNSFIEESSSESTMAKETTDLQLIRIRDFAEGLLNNRLNVSSSSPESCSGLDHDSNLGEVVDASELETGPDEIRLAVIRIDGDDEVADSSASDSMPQRGVCLQCQACTSNLESQSPSEGTQSKFIRDAGKSATFSPGRSHDDVNLSYLAHEMSNLNSNTSGCASTCSCGRSCSSWLNVDFSTYVKNSSISCRPIQGSLGRNRAFRQSLGSCDSLQVWPNVETTYKQSTNKWSGSRSFNRRTTHLPVSRSECPRSVDDSPVKGRDYSLLSVFDETNNELEFVRRERRKLKDSLEQLNSTPCVTTEHQRLGKLTIPIAFQSPHHK